MIFRLVILLFFIWPVLTRSQDSVKTKYKLPPFKDLTLVDKEDSAIANRKAYFKKNRQYKVPQEMKKHFLYVMPLTSFYGDGWLALGAWMDLCYDRIKQTEGNRIQIYGVRLGVIVASYPTKGVNDDILSGSFPWRTIPHTEKSNGFRINAEHKILLRRKFYYSTNLFFQNTTTHRKGEYLKNDQLAVNENRYKVNRSVIALIPKIGFMFVHKSGLFTDIGLGIGARYVYSYNINKINHQTNQDSDEYYISNKLFDEGGSFAQRITFQFKLGYNF